MTERDIDEVKVGMTVEMTFRRLRHVEGIYSYGNPTRIRCNAATT